MIEWVWPLMFAALPLPWVLRRLWKPADSAGPALTVPDVRLFQVHSGGPKQRAKTVAWALVLLWLIWALMVTAAARPRWTGAAVQLPTTGRDLMLAVDISGSMSQEDMVLADKSVNRLQVVKHVVNDFVERRSGDRVGLILFGTQAYLQAPLTFDRETVNRLLREAPVGIAGGKTAIGDAIALAVKRLRRRPAEERVLILLTDGASNVGQVTPAKAAELAAEHSIRIYTIGVGAESMRLPGIFGNFGARVINPSADLDEETLRAIAERTGGAFYRARNTEELAQIYGLIDALEPVEQDAETIRPVAELFHWPLTAAFALLVLTLALPPRADALPPSGAS